jgi:hypothetical protein
MLRVGAESESHLRVEFVIVLHGGRVVVHTLGGARQQLRRAFLESGDQHLLRGPIALREKLGEGATNHVLDCARGFTGACRWIGIPSETISATVEMIVSMGITQMQLRIQTSGAKKKIDSIHLQSLIFHPER